MKIEKIKLNIRPIYKLAKGHYNHISGSGQHDHRSKRQRTRNNINRKSIEEY
jgi:hypothetical protein